MQQVSTLRPGLLVSLSSSVRGNVSYRSQDIERDHLESDGTRRARWETERVIEDPAEHEEAIKVRSKCRSLVTGICSPSQFGLLCPEADSDKLSAAIEAAQEIAAEFNRRAKLTRVGVYVIAGRIAADDVQAVRAINSEVRQLLDDMESGLLRLDVDAVRAAANKAKSLGQMLAPEAQARIQLAIDAARATARRMVKAGEQAADEIDKATLRRITESRVAFLDLDEQGEIAAPETVGRAVEFEPETVATESAARPYIEGAGQLDWDAPAAEVAPVRAQARLFDLD